MSYVEAAGLTVRAVGEIEVAAKFLASPTTNPVHLSMERLFEAGALSPPESSYSLIDR